MKTIVRICAVFSAVAFMGAGALADDELDDGSEGAENAENSEGNALDGLEGLAGRIATGEQKEKYYHILPYCRTLDGQAEVLRPAAKEWEPIQEGKFYALGTEYRTVGANTRLLVMFGKEIGVEIKGEASFGTCAQPLGEPTRTIYLISGTIKVKLPRNLPDGLFIVTAPGFKTVNPKGDARYTYAKSPDGDGDTVTVRCVTGDLSIEGRHFKVLSMKPANEIRIRTTQDCLFTGLYGSRGDYIVRLDQGRHLIKDYATGESHQEEKTLDWKLSPQTAVRIHRAKPGIGEKMAVTIMTFDASGELKNRCAFTEHTVEVNSGELGPTSKKDREEIAKKAAEATETVTVEAEAKDTDADSQDDSNTPAASDDDLDFDS